jgi:hypothetical protein
MIELNDVVLQEFAKRGLSINEGIAKDARLVQSVSKALGNDELRKPKDKRDTPESKLDKKGNPLKFSRDGESDWTVKNNEPHYGLKEHVSVGIKNSFMLATTLSRASASGPEGA